MREFFKNLPDETTPIKADRLNNLLNGNEAMGSIVVDDISCKNLFNINNLTLETGSVDYSTGIITVNQYANSSIQTLKQLCPDLIVGETYTLSLSTTSTDSKFIYLHGSSTPWINGTQRIITQADLDGTIGVYGVYDSTDTYYISKIQIEKGMVATEYVPYKDFQGRKYIYTGLEMPTNEYDEGDRVYVKRVDCGYLNTGIQTIAHGITNIKNLVRYDGKYRNENVGSIYTIPRSYPTDTSVYNVDCDVNKTNITITSGTAYNGSTFKAYIDVYYTKTNG